MTTLQSGKTAKYDAWNRLVEVDNGASVVERNEYDGTNRRIQVFSNFTGTTPSKTVDEYHVGQKNCGERRDGQRRPRRRLPDDLVAPLHRRRDPPRPRWTRLERASCLPSESFTCPTRTST